MHLIIENMHSLYLGKDCVKKFCKSLVELEHVKNIIDFEKKKMLALIKGPKNEKIMLHL